MSINFADAFRRVREAFTTRLGTELEQLPVRTQVYFHRMAPYFDEFLRDVSIVDEDRRVYISPTDRDTGTIAGLLVAYFNRQRKPVVYAVYRDGMLHVPQSEQITHGPSKLLVIDHEQAPAMVEGLRSAPLSKSYGIDQAMYTWWYPQAGHVHIVYRQE